MESMQSAVLMGHTLIAILIIVLVLIQKGKGADAGAAFGAGASGTVFGAQGSSNFFSRATAVLAAAFFISSLTLAYLATQRPEAPKSLLDDLPVAEAPMETETSTIDAAFDDEDFPELPEIDSANPADDDGEIPALEPDDANAVEDSGGQ